MLSHNETAGSNAHIYGTEGLIIIIIPLSSRYCLHASDFKTALAVVFFPKTLFFFFFQTQRATMCCVWLTFLLQSMEQQNKREPETENTGFDSSRELEQNVPLLSVVQLCWQDPQHHVAPATTFHFTGVTAGSWSALRHPHRNSTSVCAGEKCFALLPGAATAACVCGPSCSLTKCWLPSANDA